jgi:hypothetical protein
MDCMNLLKKRKVCNIVTKTQIPSRKLKLWGVRSPLYKDSGFGVRTCTRSHPKSGV